MKKCLYVHGFGGSGTGTSFKNVTKVLSGMYKVESTTFDLTSPTKVYQEIKDMIKGKNLVIASSLGAFYVSSVATDVPCILLNPCLDPIKVIPLIQSNKLDIDTDDFFDACYKIYKNTFAFDEHTKGLKIGVFSDNDQLFDFRKKFKQDISDTIVEVPGPHELAHELNLLEIALDKALPLITTLKSTV